MEYQNLVQYIFWDDHEQITNQKGRIVVVKDPDTDYLLFDGKPALKVRGSAPSLDNLVGFSKVPKVGEHLVTFEGFLVFGKYYFSSVPIREINRNFQLPLNKNQRVKLKH